MSGKKYQNRKEKKMARYIIDEGVVENIVSFLDRVPVTGVRE
jgi:hypothetical protein